MRSRGTKGGLVSWETLAALEKRWVTETWLGRMDLNTSNYKPLHTQAPARTRRGKD